MREFIVQQDDANQRVDKFLQKLMPKLPKSLLYKSIRNKKIKVNRKRCEISQRLHKGDHVLCFLAEEFFEAHQDMRFLQVSAQLDIVYEDEHIAILRKPKGLLTHRDHADIQDNLTDRFLHYLYQKKEYDPRSAQSFTPAFCHRLDRNTEGLVIAAKTAEALRRMNAHIRDHEVEKRYLCIVEGHLEQREDRIVLWHQKDKKENKVCLYTSQRKDAQRIETGYHVLRQGKRYALVEVELYTGKSHQIRAVMAYLGHPLYGDVKYGAKKNATADYQTLCAYQLHFAFQDDVLSAISNRTFRLSTDAIINQFQQLEAAVTKW